MIINGVHTNGAIESRPDYRSKIVAKAVANMAPEILPDAQYTEFFRKNGVVLMQGKQPACTSHSIVYLMMLWWYLKTGRIMYFSPRFLHIVSAFPGATPEDGRDPATVLASAKNVGCCTIQSLPNDVTLLNEEYCDPSVITPVMTAEAGLYRIPGYVPIEINQTAIRQAIQTYGAVTILFNIGAEMYTDKYGNITWAQSAIDPLRPPAVIISGHEMTGIGWNNDLEHLINEWSEEWAQQGESDYLMNEWIPFIREVWAIAEVPSSVLSTVQGLPAPHEFVHTFTQHLTRGTTGDEVRALQIALSIDGENTYPEINGIFGPLTFQAVCLFQQKYASDILTPQGLTHPTGTVGPGTIKKLNSLFAN